MITVLIALGPNSIEIPCMLFESMENGKQYCDDLFPVEGTVSSDGSVRYGYEPESDDGEQVSKVLFTSHYYGCGGPCPFILKEILFNKKFVPFDLD